MGTSGKGVEYESLSVYAINSLDYTGASLINYKLNGSNYLTWSRAMLTALTTKNKVGLIDGTVPRPPEGDPNRASLCNGGSDAMGRPTGKIFTGKRNQNLPTEGRNRKFEARGVFVTKYYSRLKTLWDELDNYLEIPTCTCAATKLYAARREREKTHQFLMGLGSKFGMVRSNILSHEPAHPLNKVYAMILHEERQNIVALSHENAAPDGAVFLSKLSGYK
ncbi:hypothetical protein CRG98_029002 [Punica granatum]|uniref:Retrotransposon Copia-like N-terminal domain-containing protein n=1 Tax=Punica granatum TaxID=22663 RepID=A0A2I0J2Z7_PUNGR|nr:hypothetical protein CRG98_029002 [Punica granatum]